MLVNPKKTFLTTVLLLLLLVRVITAVSAKTSSHPICRVSYFQHIGLVYNYGSTYHTHYIKVELFRNNHIKVSKYKGITATFNRVLLVHYKTPFESFGITFGLLFSLE